MPRDGSAIGHGELLLRERFETMVAGFKSWRISEFLRQLRASKRKGQVLPFVRGLRVSAQLIYAIRELLEGSGLTANWGHLLDQEGKFCSPECDVIVHKTCYTPKWNGTEKPIMDFRFVPTSEARVVISCKSQVKTIDEKYAQEVKKYVNRVWLFGECCGPRSAKKMMDKARQAGYEKFWYLYIWSPTREEISERDFNREGWNDFVREVQKLKD